MLCKCSSTQEFVWVQDHISMALVLSWTQSCPKTQDLFRFQVLKLYSHCCSTWDWNWSGGLCHTDAKPGKACLYTGAGHIIRISSKSWFISLIPFKKWNLYNVCIHSTQTDIFQVFISFNFDDYNWQLMKTPNSVSQKIRILLKTNTKERIFRNLGQLKSMNMKSMSMYSTQLLNYCSNAAWHGVDQSVALLRCYESPGCSDSGLQLFCIVGSGISHLPLHNTP